MAHNDTPMGLMPGSYVGVYEILAPLGGGGMGEVYRARDPKLRRQVALKVLPSAFADDLDRLAALSHPNILAIHDFGRDGDITYVVTELPDGRSLGEMIDAGAIPRWKTMNWSPSCSRRRRSVRRTAKCGASRPAA